ncbi:MAG: hypothetical protein LBK06_04635 [Planctomycetaceae bacterium]|nr:hypothetical protein [Planctomycetaceae bacterium]
MSKNPLDKFPFDSNMLSCQNHGIFPDLAIKLNADKKNFSGGELIELKDSKRYRVPSFNSTIPTGQKEIAKVIKGENSIIKKQMEDAGDDINSLPIRDVYYLIRGRQKENIKVILVHGSFFETIKSADLISQSFGQVLNERLQEKELKIEKNVQDLLVDIFSEQENFSKIRNVDKASVKLRFRIMTEVQIEGNILNPKKYPDILNNTINLVIPCHNKQDEELTAKRFSIACDISQFRQLKIKHHLNGYFTAFQQDLS